MSNDKYKRECQQFNWSHQRITYKKDSQGYDLKKRKINQQRNLLAFQQRNNKHTFHPTKPKQLMDKVFEFIC